MSRGNPLDRLTRRQRDTLKVMHELYAQDSRAIGPLEIGRKMKISRVGALEHVRRLVELGLAKAVPISPDASKNRYVPVIETPVLKLVRTAIGRLRKHSEHQLAQQLEAEFGVQP